MLRHEAKIEEKAGANERNRTADLFITSELLYRLSYIGLAMGYKMVCFCRKSSGGYVFFPSICPGTMARCVPVGHENMPKSAFTIVLHNIYDIKPLG